MQYLGQNPRSLIHWTPVHVHLATSSVTARVAVLEGRVVEPGGECLVQAVLDKTISAAFGDWFIFAISLLKTQLMAGMLST